MGWGNMITFLVQIIVVVPGKFNIAKKIEKGKERERKKKRFYDRAIDIYLGLKERNVKGLV
jgi:hypothetical protein